MKRVQFGFCFSLAVASAALSQEPIDPVVIHELVGEKISKEERDKYGLFPSIGDFHSATFSRSDSSVYILTLETIKQSQIIKQTIHVSLLFMQDLAVQIESSAHYINPSNVQVLKEIAKERKRRKELFPGYAGSLFGGWISNLFVFGLSRNHDPSRAELYLVWGLGSAFFSAVGVQTAGEFDDGWRTLSTSFLGALAGSAVGIAAFEGSVRIENPGVIALVILFGKPLVTSYGAIQGYYTAAQSQYRGLLNLNKSGMSLDVPTLYQQRSFDFPERGKPILVNQVSLLRVIF